MGRGNGPESPAGDVGPPAASNEVWATARNAVAVLAFLSEIWMIVVLVIAGWSLGNGSLMSVSLAAFYPALAILIWSVWMAPRSARRLADPWRLAAQLALFAAAAALASVAGHVILGVLFGIVACGAFSVTRLIEVTGSPAEH